MSGVEVNTREIIYDLAALRLWVERSIEHLVMASGLPPEGDDHREELANATAAMRHVIAITGRIAMIEKRALGAETQ